MSHVTIAGGRRSEEAGQPRPAVPGWLTFLARRLVRIIVSVWALVTFAFLLIRLVPGDPVRASMGFITPQSVINAKRRALGLDGPLTAQYYHYFSQVLHGKLGESLSSGQPVTQILATRLPNTLALAGLAFAVVVLIAFPLGLSMAILTQGTHHQRLELAFTSTATAITAVPEYLLGVILVYLFSISTKLLPVAGNSTPSSYVLPVLALSLGPAMALARILRVEILGVLGEDYIRTARAKRLRPRIVYLRHALPNAMTATLTLGGMVLGWLIAGTVLVESIFVWPGLGPTMVSSIVNKDYPVIQGIVLVYGALVLGITLIVDIVLAVVDPRLSAIGRTER